MRTFDLIMFIFAVLSRSLNSFLIVFSSLLTIAHFSAMWALMKFVPDSLRPSILTFDHLTLYCCSLIMTGRRIWELMGSIHVLTGSVIRPSLYSKSFCLFIAFVMWILLS